MALDLTSLANAVARLDEGLARYRRDPSDGQIRDGLIQRFEFTYEISHKMIRRWLPGSAATPSEYESADFSYLIRSANEQGLLRSDWRRCWKRFRDMRARTSHSYDEKIALEVVTEIPDFLEEARHLVAELERRRDT